MIEVEPGSPEDRILTAVIEGMEASGEIITPKVRNRMTCSFMMGYTAGFSVASIRNVSTVEETIKQLIQDVNKVVFTDMIES